MLALAGGIGGVTMLESARADTRQRHVPNLGEDQLYVGLGGTGQGPLLASRPAAASSEELADLVDAVTAAVPGSVAGVVAPASGAVIGDDPRGLAVGDAATLDALGASSAQEAFDDGQIVALGRGSTDDGQVVLHRRAGRGPTQVFQGHVDDRGRELPGGTDGPPWAPQELAAVEVDVPLRMAVPGYILSPAAAEALGVEAVPQGVLLRGPGPVTEEDLRRVELAALDAAPSVPAYVVREDGPCCGDEALVTGVLLGASALVALLVVGLVIALGREELRPHLATLAAVGAAPRTRRRLGATQAGLVAGLAAALAVPTGLLPAVALLRARPAQPGLGPLTSVGEALTAPVVVPWLVLAGVVLGVTVLGTLAGGVLSFAHRR
jgi:putative ABC transport system permease protein